MGGPNLEVFKFGFYLFTPIYVMVKFADPEWYHSHVVPLKEMFWPPYEETHQPPRTHAGIQEELAKLRAERLAKKQAREALEGGADAAAPAAAAANDGEGHEAAHKWKWGRNQDPDARFV
ncbi:hypothetical protein IAT38_008035 [Cryptococcus sp. DSM 104549]